MNAIRWVLVLPFIFLGWMTGLLALVIDSGGTHGSVGNVSMSVFGFVSGAFGILFPAMVAPSNKILISGILYVVTLLFSAFYLIMGFSAVAFFAAVGGMISLVGIVIWQNDKTFNAAAQESKKVRKYGVTH